MCLEFGSEVRDRARPVRVPGTERVYKAKRWLRTPRKQIGWRTEVTKD